MNILKRSLAMLLTLCMLVSVVPMTTFATGTDSIMADASESTEALADYTEGTAKTTKGTTSDFMKVFHLDCGRKYFTVAQVKEMLDAISNVGFSHMELAIGNDGLRLLLDDMSIEANGTTYASDTIKSGIQSGNIAYSHAGEWSEAEMNEIIAYAKSKGVEIIPLVNNPGHMDTILAAMNACGIDGYYKSSARTVDLENEEAVAFTQAMVMKYAEYFAAKGCKYFNIGADEYANDYHTSDSTGMGFGALISNNKYGNFITYVNALVEDICDLGMTPIAFNDGIYFRENTSFGTFDTRLMVAAWSGGWGGIKPASTTFLQNKGHKILNTNERWYYVLGRKQSVNSTYCYESALSNAKSESVTTVTDHNTGVTSVGAMQCVWCDDPSVNYETYKSNVMTLINTLAENNSDYFTGPNVVEPEVPETVTKTDEVTGVVVSAPGLESVEIEENVAVISEEKVTKTYAITLNNGTYTENATVKIPYDTAFDGCNSFVGYVDEDSFEVTREGEFFVCEVPHFSDVTIEGRAVVADTVSSSGTTGPSYVKDVDGIDANAQYVIVYANKALSYNGSSITAVDVKENSDGTLTIPENVTSANLLWKRTTRGMYNESHERYLNIESSCSMSSNEQNVTFTSYNDGYRVYKDGTRYDYYLRYNDGWTGTWSTTNATRVELYKYNASTASYVVTPELQESRINEYAVTNNGYTDDTWSAYQDALVAAQNKLAEVKGKTYDGESTANTALNELISVVDDLEIAKNALTKAVQITIKYVDGNNKTIKTENVTVNDSATNVSLSNFNYNGKFYVVEETTLAITPSTVTNYTVKVTETAEDLSVVEALEIEYWITNHPVTPDNQIVNTSNVDHNGDTQTNVQRVWIDIKATETSVYSETGADLKNLVAASGVDAHMTGNHVVLWKGVSLNIEEYQQTTDENDNESYNGTDFTRVRYWNGAWQVFDGSSWIAVSEKTQLVAYYLQKTVVTNLDVVQTEVVDWGEVYGESSYGDANFVAMDFAIKYEDGTRNPDAFAVAGKTLMFHCDYNNALDKTVFIDSNNKYYRRIGTIRATETSNYEVYMITITPNSNNVSTSIASRASGIKTINYAGTEKVVWVDDMANLGQFEDTSLQHADFTVGGEPSIRKVDIYNKQAVLITYYVKAKVTEDSLTVHYIDQTAGNVEFYNYNIAVNKGTYFADNIALPNPWKGNLVNGTIQTLDKDVKQTVSSDLETLPAVAAQYLYSDYECVRIELKKTTVENENGTSSDVAKDLYLYYTFNPTVTFVADFGLPIKIEAKDLNLELEGNVTDMSIPGSTYTAYGQLIDNGNYITYKPTKIMKSSDFFTVLVNTKTASGILDNASTQVAFRVYVTPATTVHYEESFINWETNWSGRNEAITVENQSTEVLGAKKNSYGYDSAYDIVSGASNGTNASASVLGTKGIFTFTGNGVEVFADCKENTGYVSVMIQNSAGKTVKFYMVNTAALNGTSDATNSQTGNFYGTPIVSVNGLAHDTYTVTVTKIMEGEKTVYIDGIRVFNTLANSSTYAADLEDNPEFYQLRDVVLKALNVETKEDLKSKYGSISEMAEQVYGEITSDSEQPAAILTNSAYAGDINVQDLLDNGPKNELFLRKGQTLVFSVTTNRLMQLGVSAPTGETKYSVSVDTTKVIDNATLSSSVDMFRKLADPIETAKAYTVTVTNNGDNILSVTDLKICDDPSMAFNNLTEKDVEYTLKAMGYGDSEPEAPVEPEVTYADATLNLSLVDYKGKAVAKLNLTSNGKEGTDATFTKAEIKEAVLAALPKGYDVVDVDKIVDQLVAHGESANVKVKVGKVATLVVSFVKEVNKKGGKTGPMYNNKKQEVVETVVLTAVQTSKNGSYTFKASEIKKEAPKGFRVDKVSNTKVNFGTTKQITVKGK